MLDFKASPVRWPLNLARFIPSYVNHQRMKMFERHEVDYVLLNDVAHDWQGVFYYTDRAAQKRQIEAAGLSLIECLGEDGRILTEDEDDRQDGLIHYVCIKAG